MIETPKVETGMSRAQAITVGCAIASTAIAGAGLFLAFKQQREAKAAAEAQAKANEIAVDRAAAAILAAIEKKQKPA